MIVSQVPDNILSIFWVEAAEYLESLNQILLLLEVAQPGDDQNANLREVSRIAHSLKGAARAVGQTTIESLSHQMETVFDAALAGQLALEPEVCDALYDSLDVIQGISSEREIDPEVVAQVLEQLTKFAAAQYDSSSNNRPASPAPVAEQEVPPHPTTRKTQTALIAPSPIHTTDDLAPAHHGEDTVRVRISKLDELMGQTGELLVAKMHSDQCRQDIRALLQQHIRWQQAWRQVRTAYFRAMRHLPHRSTEQSDDLADLLGFLEVTQQYMSQSRRELSNLNQALTQDSLHLSSLADELQSDIAATRMLPFETILSTFQRMVRDLARETGKEVELVIEGADVEVDKHVLESLKDPLLHTFRNAVDHGIESPEVREAAGKPAKGTVRLTITQRGSNIQVSVSDDGGGIDPEAVRDKAIDKGVITVVEANAMTQNELAALIFMPRFSTAAEITTVSGRGVGLDVVQQRIEALRGRIWLENTPGAGSTFHLVVPVSLTRLHCLLARAGDEIYAIPLNSVVRIVNLAGAEHFTIEDRPMIKVLDRPTPLVYLADVLDRPGSRAAPNAETPVLILQATERAVALIIDELLSEQELVLKPLGPELSRVRNVAGAAILGTGQVVMILNANDLIKSVRRRPARRIAEDAGQDAPVERDRDRPARILVVDDSITTRALEKNILETAGFYVRTVTDGTEAIQALLEDSYDLLVSDVEMPNMDGFELTRQVKSDARWKHMPVVLVTSLDSPTDRERGLQAGADAYLVKPRFDQDELLQMIEKMV